MAYIYFILLANTKQTAVMWAPGWQLISHWSYNLNHTRAERTTALVSPIGFLWRSQRTNSGLSNTCHLFLPGQKYHLGWLFKIMKKVRAEVKRNKQLRCTRQNRGNYRRNKQFCPHHFFLTFTKKSPESFACILTTRWSLLHLLILLLYIISNPA